MAHEDEADGCELDFSEHAMTDEEVARLLDPQDKSVPLDKPLEAPDV